MGSLSLRSLLWSSAVLVLVGGFVAPLRAQLPKDQDKIGEGAVGHKQPEAGIEPSPMESKAGSKGLTQGASKLNGTRKEKSIPVVGEAKADGKPGAKDKVVYDFELPGADGKGLPMASFKGKTVVLVNLARNSSYNTQLAALEKLSEEYKARGLVVVGVPSNEFGAAEPGTDPEIQKVYKTDDKITFPITAKAELTGDKGLPLYAFLTKGKAAPAPGPVHWNYTKFLIDKTGKPIARFDQDVAPDSPEFLSTLEQVLSGTWKPKKNGDGPEVGDGDGNEI